MNTKAQFQVCFFPITMMEDFLSEKTIWVNAETPEEAQSNAEKELGKDEDSQLYYRMDKPLIHKVA